MFGELSIIDFLIASPTMIVLAICSIITVGFAVERLLYFNSTRSNTRQFMNELGNRMKSGNPRTALDFCSQKNSPVARVMAQGIMHMGRSRDELQQRLDTAIDMETVEMERNLGVLGTMSNIAPLLTTAAGIVVAVIATVGFNFFVRQIRTRTAQLEDSREAYFTIWHQYNKRARQATGVAATSNMSAGIPNGMPAAKPKSVKQEDPLAAVLR